MKSPLTTTPSRPANLFAAIIAGALLTPSLSLAATLKVESAFSEKDSDFRVEPVVPPSTNDAAKDAKFTIIDGRPARRRGDPTAVLHDGRVPSEAEERGQNFSFEEATGGRIVVDLGKPISIKEINTYSWHPEARGPQNYELFAAKGDEANFSDSPKRPTDPTTASWVSLTKVNTTEKGKGGQHLVSIRNTETGPVGEYRYLLFDIQPATAGEPMTNTTFNEIDVVDANGPAPIPVPVKKLVDYTSGKYKYTVDYTVAPDLVEWTEKELMPLAYEWYPKIIEMLPSDGYESAQSIKFEYREDLGGTPAYATGNRLCFNVQWFRTQLKGEAKGCVVHELTHIVQRYGRGNSRCPGWVSEGIPDYIRWFIYEPEKKGAEITKGNWERSNYDSSYRVSANFLNWVVENKDKEFIKKLNAVSREGTYSEKVWQDATGKTAAELGAEWKEANKVRLGIP